MMIILITSDADNDNNANYNADHNKSNNNNNDTDNDDTTGGLMSLLHIRLLAFLLTAARPLRGVLPGVLPTARAIARAPVSFSGRKTTRRPAPVGL